MKKALTPIEIKNLIYNVRGKAVMLDSDLAKLYGVTTKVLNQAVKRNMDRFPDDFAFALTRDEIKSISQSVISLKFSKNVNVFSAIRQLLETPPTKKKEKMGFAGDR